MIRHNGIEICRNNHTIKHAGSILQFRPKQDARKHVYAGAYRFKVFTHLIMDWASYPELFDLVWGNCPDGGPNAGPQVFDIRFYQWRKDFAYLRLKLERDKRAGIRYVKLVPDVV